MVSSDVVLFSRICLYWRRGKWWTLDLRHISYFVDFMNAKRFFVLLERFPGIFEDNSRVRQLCTYEL